MRKSSKPRWGGILKGRLGDTGGRTNEAVSIPLTGPHHRPSPTELEAEPPASTADISGANWLEEKIRQWMRPDGSN